MSEEDYNNGILTEPTAVSELLRENPIYYYTNAETDRMKNLARERFNYVEKIFKLKQEEPENYTILLKIGLATTDENGNIDNEHLEHIWFELDDLNGSEFTATLTQEPYAVPEMKAGDREVFTLNSLTDWIIYTPNGAVTPDQVYLLELED